MRVLFWQRTNLNLTEEEVEECERLILKKEMLIITLAQFYAAVNVVLKTFCQYLRQLGCPR